MIPLFEPTLNGNELRYIKQCIDSTWISSAGSFVTKFEDSIKSYTGSKYAIACMNGTSGLHLSLLAFGIKKGQIVIAPNLTFVATLNAISYSGATPLLFDINEKTWQLDINLLENWLKNNTISKFEDGKKSTFHKISNEKIAAIMPVHVLGGICNMDELIELSKKYNIPIIEDSAEAIGTRYKSSHAGSIGKMGVFSFNGNKIITTGSGGMIITDDKNLATKVRHLSTTAKTDPINFFHDEVGYNYRLVNVLAAIGLAQMEELDSILEKKKNIDQTYKNNLKGVGDIQFQNHVDNSKPNFWLFTIRTRKMRGLIDYLNDNGIQSRPFWTPMNKLPMYQKLNYITKCDISNKIFNESLSIPCSANLSAKDQETVIEKIKDYFKK